MIKLSTILTLVIFCHGALSRLSESPGGKFGFMQPWVASQHISSWTQTSKALNNESNWRTLAHDEPYQISGWHPRKVELHDLVPIHTIQPRRLEVVLHHAEFGQTPVLAKLAASPKDLPSLSHEDAMYRLLYGLDVTPRFLGLVTTDGRIVGFLTEYVEPHETSFSSGSKFRACLAALRKMHTRGIAHGDAHGENCLMRGDGSAVLIDFELTLETSAQAEFDRDLWIMMHTAGD